LYAVLLSDDDDDANYNIAVMPWL